MFFTKALIFGMTHYLIPRGEFKTPYQKLFSSPFLCSEISRESVVSAIVEGAVFIIMEIYLSSSPTIRILALASRALIARYADSAAVPPPINR